MVSYNIKHGLGNDGKLNLERTAEVLKKLKPDLVGLQEVDENTGRCGDVNQAKRLGELLGMKPAFGPFMDFDGGRYGLAILSRYPIRNVEVVRLPRGNEPRVALAVEIELPNQARATIINLHFDWVKDDKFRYAQASELAEFLTELKNPYVLLGDFNDQPNSRTLELLRKGRLEASKPPEDHFTFSAEEPRIEIDYIFCGPPDRWRVEDVEVVDEPMASDHRPVRADLRLMDQ